MMELQLTEKKLVEAKIAADTLSQDYSHPSRQRISERFQWHDSRMAASTYFRFYWLSRVGANRSAMMKLVSDLFLERFPTWPSDYSLLEVEQLGKDFNRSCSKYRYKSNLKILGEELRAFLKFSSENDLLQISLDEDETLAFDTLANCTAITADRAAIWLFDIRTAHGVKANKFPIEPIHTAWLQLFYQGVSVEELGHFEQSLMWSELANSANFDPVALIFALREISFTKVRHARFLERFLANMGLVS